MLMKQMGSQSGDFHAMLKKRFLWGGAALFVGGLAMVLSGTLLVSSPLPDFVRGIYSGAGAGGATCGAALCLHSWYLWRHPDKARAAMIKETDERERKVADTAAKWAFYAVLFALVPALLIAAPLNLTVFWTLYVLLMAMGAAVLVSTLVAKRLM